MCGQKDSEAWAFVPLNQAQFHMRVFLEKRGYFAPEFEIENNVLQVKLGPRSFARNLIFHAFPQAFPAERKRAVEGSVLTPSLLNEVEDWSQAQLRSHGFPCPKTSIVADPKTGKVVVTTEPGPYQRFSVVKREEVRDIHEEVLKRYDAFVMGQRFNGDLLQLTSDRLVRDGIVQSAHFQVECAADGALVTENLIPGKPRVVVIGIGASTEEFPLFRASWKSVRLGALGSSLRASTFLSSREQEAVFGGQFYLFPNTPAFYLNPNIQVQRQDEPSFETVTTRATARAGYSFDDQDRHYMVEAGPAYNDIYVIEGEGPGHSTFLTIDTVAELMSHYYEYYRPSPRAGYLLRFNSKSRRAGLYSDVSADRLELQGKILYNYQNYDPPLLIAGMRFRLASTRYNKSAQQPFELPPEYRFYLGGDDNIRGFSRNEINGPNDQGYLTAAYTGFELRLADLVPKNIEPFIFADVAITGTQAFTFDNGYYWAPGAGFRWQTFVGVFRGTAAYGVVKNAQARVEGLESHWQFFLSYGQEF